MQTSSRVRARDSVLVLLGCIACGGWATVEGVSSGEGCAELEVENDGDVTLRCGSRLLQLIDADTVDVLFVVDDGPEAGALQQRLVDAMDELVARVAVMNPQPDLRIGFTSSRDAHPSCGDATGRVVLSSCREHPETFVAADGTDRFADLCTANCELDEIATANPWIEIVRGDTDPAGTAVTDALRCASLLGVSGCPFPAPHHATRSAFLRSEQDIDAGGVGFFRRDASPIVVWVTSGAECSLGPAGLAAFDPQGSRALWSDPELATAGLCWNAGVECTQPDDAGVMSCRAADIGVEGRATGPDDAVLEPTAELAKLLGDVANARRDYDPLAEVRVFAITGVPAAGIDGSTNAVAPADEATAARYGVQPTCMLDDEAMLPPVRLAALGELADAHELAEPTLLSACTDDFAPALGHVATAIEDALRPSCMPACVADVDPSTPSLQIACNLVVQSPRSGGGIDESQLVGCDASTSGEPVVPAGEPGCFATRTGADMHPTCIEEGWNLEFDLVWNGAKPSGTSFIATCQLSNDKESDCPDL